MTGEQSGNPGAPDLVALSESIKALVGAVRAVSDRVDILQERADANMRRIDQAVGGVAHLKGEVASLARAYALDSGDRTASEDERRSLERRIGALAERIDRAEAALNQPAMERLDFVQRACLQAGHDLELALQQAMGEAMRDPETAELAAGFPEINPANYNEGDVWALNAWGIAAAQRLRDVGVVATSAPIVERLAGIIYRLRDLGIDERLAVRMRQASGGEQITSATWARAAPVASYHPIDAGVRRPDRAVVVSEGVLGQILTHVAMGNPDAALALTTPATFGKAGDRGGEPVRTEYCEIKSSNYGPEGFPVGGMVVPDHDGVCRPTSDVVTPSDRADGDACRGCPKPAASDDMRAAGGST